MFQLEQTILILAAAFAYMNIVGITLFILFKIGDPSNVAQLASLDGVAKQLGELTKTVTIGAAKVLAVGAAAGLTGAGGSVAGKLSEKARDNAKPTLNSLEAQKDAANQKYQSAVEDGVEGDELAQKLQDRDSELANIDEAKTEALQQAKDNLTGADTWDALTSGSTLSAAAASSLKQTGQAAAGVASALLPGGGGAAIREITNAGGEGYAQGKRIGASGESTGEYFRNELAANQAQYDQNELGRLTAATGQRGVEYADKFAIAENQARQQIGQTRAQGQALLTGTLDGKGPNSGDYQKQASIGAQQAIADTYAQASVAGLVSTGDIKANSAKQAIEQANGITSSANTFRQELADNHSGGIKQLTREPNETDESFNERQRTHQHTQQLSSYGEKSYNAQLAQAKKGFSEQGTAAEVGRNYDKEKSKFAEEVQNSIEARPANITRSAELTTELTSQKTRLENLQNAEVKDEAQIKQAQATVESTQLALDKVNANIDRFKGIDSVKQLDQFIAQGQLRSGFSGATASAVHGANVSIGEELAVAQSQAIQQLGGFKEDAAAAGRITYNQALAQGQLASHEKLKGLRQAESTMAHGAKWAATNSVRDFIGSKQFDVQMANQNHAELDVKMKSDEAVDAVVSATESVAIDPKHAKARARLEKIVRSGVSSQDIKPEELENRLRLINEEKNGSKAKLSPQRREAYTEEAKAAIISSREEDVQTRLQSAYQSRAEKIVRTGYAKNLGDEVIRQDLVAIEEGRLGDVKVAASADYVNRSGGVGRVLQQGQTEFLNRVADQSYQVEALEQAGKYYVSTDSSRKMKWNATAEQTLNMKDMTAAKMMSHVDWEFSASNDTARKANAEVGRTLGGIEFEHNTRARASETLNKFRKTHFSAIHGDAQKDSQDFVMKIRAEENRNKNRSEKLVSLQEDLQLEGDRRIDQQNVALILRKQGWGSSKTTDDSIHYSEAKIGDYQKKVSVKSHTKELHSELQKALEAGGVDTREAKTTTDDLIIDVMGYIKKTGQDKDFFKTVDNTRTSRGTKLGVQHLFNKKLFNEALDAVSNNSNKYKEKIEKAQTGAARKMGSNSIFSDFKDTKFAGKKDEIKGFSTIVMEAYTQEQIDTLEKNSKPKDGNQTNKGPKTRKQHTPFSPKGDIVRNNKRKSAS